MANPPAPESRRGVPARRSATGILPSIARHRPRVFSDRIPTPGSPA